MGNSGAEEINHNRRPIEGNSEDYAEKARGALVIVLGDSGASAMLYYTGEPRPENFETRLRRILGGGADVVMQEMTK